MIYAVLNRASGMKLGIAMDKLETETDDNKIAQLVVALMETTGGNLEVGDTITIEDE